MEGGISISEDPNIRFTYVPNGAKHFRVEAKDTCGPRVSEQWKATGSDLIWRDIGRWRADREHRRGSETSHFCFRLGSSRSLSAVLRPARRAELPRQEISCTCACSARFRP